MDPTVIAALIGAVSGQMKQAGAEKLAEEQAPGDLLKSLNPGQYLQQTGFNTQIPMQQKSFGQQLIGGA